MRKSAEMTTPVNLQVAEQPTHSIHSIMEPHGLGKEIWEGIDAQEYMHCLRDEWERPA